MELEGSLPHSQEPAACLYPYLLTLLNFLLLPYLLTYFTYLLTYLCTYILTYLPTYSIEQSPF